MSTSETAVEEVAGFSPVVYEDEPLYEVINGQDVIKPPMGVYEAVIASRLGFQLGNFAEEQDLGLVAIATLFRIFPDRKTMRRPDVALVSYERWGRERELTSANANGWEVVPDLAVEVMAKVHDYLGAGVAEVWLLYPDLRRVHRFDAEGRITSLGPEGTLGGGQLLPGFSMTLTDLFRRKP